MPKRRHFTADAHIADALHMHVGYWAAFTALDWSVLIAYLLMLAGISLWLSRGKHEDTADYFLGGRKLPAWAAAMSVLATSISAATFIGTPQQGYHGNFPYLTSYLGLILAAIIVAFIFIPAFYRSGVTSIYTLLELRYGSATRSAASGMFMVGRVLASGARLYIGGIAGAAIAFGIGAGPEQVRTAIFVMMFLGAAYTFIGGIKAVIWTDVIQCFVLMAAAIVAIILLLRSIPADFSQMLAAWREPGPEQPSMLRLVDGPVAGAYSLPSILIGWVLLGIGSFGTDQDLTQRMLTCRTAGRGGLAAFAGVFISAPVALLFMVVGLLLWIYYQQPALMGSAMPDTAPVDSGRVFLSFILDRVPSGVGGLMMAGLFAAAISSLNSELNAMSSTLITDFYRRWRPNETERHYVRAGRIGVAFWAVMLGGFAMICVELHNAEETSLIDFALGVMTFAYSGLIAVFLAALLTRRGAGWSAIAALITGFVIILAFRLKAIPLQVDFTWQLTIAVAAAFSVCMFGKETKYRSAEEKN